MIELLPIALPDQQHFKGQDFPSGFTCQPPRAPLPEVIAWAKSQAGHLAERLESQGALLFRGFPITLAQEFDQFVASFPWTNFAYEDSFSNAVRINLTERVFTANEAPSEVRIFLHHELAQTPFYPSKLFFFCERAPELGGQTPLCRSDILWEQLVTHCPEFAQQCEQRGLKYTNVMPPENDFGSGMGRSWRSTLRVESREAAEDRLMEFGYTWKWRDDGCLTVTTPLLPAVRELPGGRKSFFNQLLAAYQGWKDSRNDPSRAIRFGDGSALDREDVMVAAQLADELTYDLAWQQGDVALVDNLMVMHGRRPFQGPRRVLASLVQ